MKLPLLKEETTARDLPLLLEREIQQVAAIVGIACIVELTN
jgi:hypothetical protein